MNDQHAHAGYAAYDGYQNGSYETDPLFGNLSGAPGGYGDPQAQSGQYDSAQWGTGAHQTAGYDAYATPQYDTSGQWATVTADAGYQQPVDIRGQAEPDATAQWDANAWNQADPLNGTGQTAFDATGFAYGVSGQMTAAQAAQFETAQFDAGQLQSAPFAYEPTAQWMAPTFDTGAYDATAWNTAGTVRTGPQDTVLVEAVVPEQYHPETPYEADSQYGADNQYTPHEQHEPARQYDAAGQYAPEGQYEQDGPYDTDAEHGAQEQESGDGPDAEADRESGPGPDPVHMAATMTAPAINVTPQPVRRAGGSGNGGRGRRRTPAKRSALLTVAVPSACVMGVAGIAAASVGGLAGGEEQDDTTTTASAADPGSVKPVAANNKLDTQLAALSADARDFGDRASRTQERIDLKARQEAEKKRRADEAARKEALRPKFALPVAQHGLSAFYGQAGVNWMSVHTGIDFPVSYGTPVMAATDGTVRTQWNSAYGNMAIVTSPDGTETWYCHLSSTKIRSGTVKAGEVIAYSGNSGNSTGPHLHFEVRPGGGSAIDPLPWLRSHGLNPS
ncbi:M23 family metallopeptidase [Streptomyces sp. AK02-01A]|uniref:M23 family metallopeptidase n=1 Tax=Streptomyces sp. AK02-01A TaxID=3028648 RepID=UPI0029A05174|nr:M23 family metallopeptidase [Streptomyces sp. AK02-01A]MDX3852225.1 M23 family metallopeptidase [Streptomyces sp. AK02-01A]